MFEVGREYTFHFWEPGENGGDIKAYHRCEVLEVDLPLVRIRQSSMHDITINAASHTFVSAELERNDRSAAMWPRRESR
jgi:hypothetical protein